MKNYLTPYVVALSWATPILERAATGDRTEFDRLAVHLNQRQQRVMVRLFGIGWMRIDGATLAAEMGVSRQRVQQLKEQAVIRLWQASKGMVQGPGRPRDEQRKAAA